MTENPGHSRVGMGAVVVCTYVEKVGGRTVNEWERKERALERPGEGS